VKVHTNKRYRKQISWEITYRKSFSHAARTLLKNWSIHRM